MALLLGQTVPGRNLAPKQQLCKNSDSRTSDVFPLWCHLGKIMPKKHDFLNSFRKISQKKANFGDFLEFPIRWFVGKRLNSEFRKKINLENFGIPITQKSEFRKLWHYGGATILFFRSKKMGVCIIIPEKNLKL